jgi:hypothetical protein
MGDEQSGKAHRLLENANNFFIVLNEGSISFSHRVYSLPIITGSKAIMRRCRTGATFFIHKSDKWGENEKATANNRLKTSAGPNRMWQETRSDCSVPSPDAALGDGDGEARLPYPIKKGCRDLQQPFVRFNF